MVYQIFPALVIEYIFLSPLMFNVTCIIIYNFAYSKVCFCLCLVLLIYLLFPHYNAVLIFSFILEYLIRQHPL